ncbi:MAG: trypsin-like peptidase domain-containing protein [Caldilineaceae bacterium]|nr:trypsin-like peptidase domain-containing protein [Caldilineaceae bacterium]
MENLQSYSNALADLAEAAGEYAVRVEARRRMPATGVIWSADGVIVTSHHAVQREDDLFVDLPDGRRVEAALAGRDPETDLAILKVDAADLAVPGWRESADVRVGEIGLALARPGENIQAAGGIISAVGDGPHGHHGHGHHHHGRRHGHGTGRGRGEPNGDPKRHAWGRAGGGPYIRTDILMYPGFSGGPLVMTDGLLAGVNTSALRHGASMAVPGETIARVVETLLTHGRMPRGYLGVGLQPVRLAEALQATLEQETGLMILSVEPDGPAAAAGLVQGDVLLALDEEPTTHVDALQALLAGDRAGATVLAQYVRGGQIEETDITIGTV